MLPYNSFWKKKKILKMKEHKRKGKGESKGQRKENLSFAVSSSKCINSQNGGRLRPRARDSALVSPVGGKDPCIWAIKCCFPWCSLAGNWIVVSGTRLKPGTPHVEREHLRQWLSNQAKHLPRPYTVLMVWSSEEWINSLS